MKTKLHTLLLLLIVWISKDVRAQNYTDMPAFKKANSWCMFKSPYLDMTTFTQPTYIADFNVSPPVFHTVPEFANVAYATAADPVTGDLLFYSDGQTIWNRDFAPMPNGTGLSGDGYARQGVCIVEKVNDPGKYYVFSIPSVPLFGSSACDLHYSVVDMSLDGGKGDVIPAEKNILLDEGPLGEMMIAVPGSQCDVWLLVHPYSEPVFKAYHITEEGIDSAPVLSHTDSTLYGYGAYVSGCLAVSPDRSKIALASNGKLVCFAMGYTEPEAGGTLLAEFDPATGTVFNDTKLNDSAAYGVAFSPDGSLLYTSDISSYMVIYDDSDTGRVYQYDVSDYPATLTLANTDVLIGSWPVNQLRMLPNGHLLGSTFLYYTDPDESGTAAGLDTNRYSWWPDGLIGSIGLGNDLVFALPADTTQKKTDTFFCKNGALSIDMAAAGTTYTWDNGSADSTRNITEPGKYWVRYLTDRCNVTVDTFIVAEYNPDVDLGDDIVLCGGNAYTFIPSVVQEGMAFLWSDGSTGDSLDVSQSGTYWVQTEIKGCRGSDTVKAVLFPDISNVLGEDISLCKGIPVSLSLSVPSYPGSEIRWSTGAATNTIAINDTGTYIVSVTIPPCSGEDSIVISREVCECYFDVPTAFSPNNDGLNDLFKIALEPGCPVQGYVLSIYNRYGQRIFIGWGPDEGWDGTYNGQQADPGVYMYELRFFGGTRQIAYSRQGDITLIK